jgi:predicted dienelactone hydrolase
MAAIVALLCSLSRPLLCGGPAGELYKLKPGPLVVRQVDVTWHDAKRDRDVPARIYLPEGTGLFPVIVFSHGLGGTREGYGYLGKHWASYGYVCVHVQHLGSDREVFLTGTPLLSTLGAAMDRNNWRDRPLDVSFALDQLDKANKDDPVLKGRIDLEKVGVAGHSFGAYTTLAVIGFDVALQPPVTLRDPRVKAAIAMSSPGKIGGATAEKAYSKIATPCLHMTGTKDESALFGTSADDRRRPYDSIRAPDQYLIIIKDADHFAFSDNKLDLLGGLQKRVPEHHDYIRAATTAFWDAYLKGDENAKAWLRDGGFAAVVKDDATIEHK